MLGTRGSRMRNSNPGGSGKIRYFNLIVLLIFTKSTLGDRDFSCAVSGFGKAARDFGLRPKICRPAADT